MDRRDVGPCLGTGLSLPENPSLLKRGNQYLVLSILPLNHDAVFPTVRLVHDTERVGMTVRIQFPPKVGVVLLPGTLAGAFADRKRIDGRAGAERKVLLLLRVGGR